MSDPRYTPGNHDDVRWTSLLEGYLDGTLSDGELAVFEAHYFVCVVCQAHLRVRLLVRSSLEKSGLDDVS